MSEIRQSPTLITAGGKTIRPPYTLSLDNEGLALAASTGENPVVVSDKTYDSVDDLKLDIASKLDNGIPHLVEDETGIPREQPVSLFDSEPEHVEETSPEGDLDAADAPKRESSIGRPTAMPPR